MSLQEDAGANEDNHEGMLSEQELKETFTDLIKLTVDLMQQEGFTSALSQCQSIFESLSSHQREKYGDG